MNITKRVTPALAVCAAAGWLTVIATPAQATSASVHPAPACTYQLTNVKPGGYVNVRTAPALNSRPVGTLRASGGRLTGGCASTRGWIAVRSSNGRSGWAYAHYLRRSTPTHRTTTTRPSLACTYQVANVRRSSYLNVRTAPGVGARRIGALRVSDGRFAGGCTSSRGWIAVKSSNARSGWASAYYLHKVAG
ncbi:hypothetical protein GCM10023194_29270 [Planotetraspora phitsanulokensis]|uniref:SH3b domain-containing protein n=1 Tax=Planotetraspora phitsanulokensis TaxID=575192 RepID=A0A8J3U092_9ACTN|nr:SH3 domain-containing protein [Planotetraspora phitsanulokensis]GII35935.1 hypothetical protein Pph01_09380 [Planotetraspora phitsanulokensis]